MGNRSFEDKFVAFIDVMGFKSMVEAAECGQGRSVEDIQAILKELAHTESKDFFAKYGPERCPGSQRVNNHLSFEITQTSDCAIVSAEVSPAGAINLIGHCWGRVIMLLTMGVMVRGYITRGSIFHEDNHFMGTGYNTAYQREGGVTAFKKEADEKGTPFVEVDPSVVAYINEHGDVCVKEMFSRMAESDGEVTALYPFKRLGHSFIIGGFGYPPFDPDGEKRNNDKVRSSIKRFVELVNRYVSAENEAAMRKTRHYVAALEAQLKQCDRTDEMIEALSTLYPSRR